MIRTKSGAVLKSQIRTKVTAAVVLKAAGDGEGLEPGQFTAYASVFGNVDSYGDVVQPGAFADTLAEWKASGDVIPVYWSHLMGSDPEFNIGWVLDAAEDDRGLLVTVQLDVEGNPKAKAVHRLITGRRVRQMSFAYDIVEATPIDDEDQDDDGWGYWGGLNLTALRLHEVSVVPIGANQETEILASKSAEIARTAVALQGGRKAGRMLSSANYESLQSARDSIDAVLKAADANADNGDQEKATGAGAVKAEDSHGGNAEEPADESAVDLLTAELSILQAKGTRK